MVAMKANATVAGQTSVRAPEKAAFEAQRPHSLLSFVTRVNCEPRRTTSRTICPFMFGPETN